jgi:hypothetical protein
MMYRKLFGFREWESVRCFINGLGRLDFEHIYLWLRTKCLKSIAVCDNVVINKLSSVNKLSIAVSKFCYDHTALILTTRFTSEVPGARYISFNLFIV